MARGRRERTDKRRGTVLGWILIIPLLAALAVGGYAVYRAAAYWKDKVNANIQTLSTPAVTPQPEPQPAQETPQPEPMDAAVPDVRPERGHLTGRQRSCPHNMSAG